jgi:hypothetical protein
MRPLNEITELRTDVPRNCFANEATTLSSPPPSKFQTMCVTRTCDVTGRHCTVSRSSDDTGMTPSGEMFSVASDDIVGD